MLSFRSLATATAFAFMALASLPAHADLIGTTVNGTLQGMYYDNQGNVSYGNNLFSTSSATVGNGAEFVFNEQFGQPVQQLFVQADFSNSILSIYTYTTLPGFIDHQFVFSDPTFYGVTYLGNSPMVTTSFSGDTITIDFLSPPAHYYPGTYNELDSFLIQTSPTIVTPPAVTPEPSSLLLIGTGLLGIAAMTRRRLSGWATFPA